MNQKIAVELRETLRHAVALAERLRGDSDSVLLKWIVRDTRRALEDLTDCIDDPKAVDVTRDDIVNGIARVMAGLPPRGQSREAIVQPG